MWHLFFTCVHCKTCQICICIAYALKCSQYGILEHVEHTIQLHINTYSVHAYTP